MTLEAQRIAIARVCNWDHDPISGWCYKNPLTDLNAMPTRDQNGDPLPWAC